MVLIREPEQPRIHAARLQGVVVGQALLVRHAVVERTVDDERGRAHVAREGVRALCVNARHVVPVPGAQFLGVPGVGVVGEHGRPVEAARVADIGGVAAGLHMAVHPGHHVAAVAAARGEDALAVGPWLLQERIGGGFHVLQFEFAPAVRDAVLEGIAEARRAVVIDGRDDVALRGEGLHVPAEVPGIAEGGVRAPVDQVQQRPLLLRVEAGRVRDPDLHLVAERAGHRDLLGAARCHAGHQGVVEVLDAARLLAGQVHFEFRRVVHRVGQRHQRAGGLVETLHPTARHHRLGPAVGQVEAPQVLAAALFGGEQQGLAVLFPVQRRVDLVVPFGADDFPGAGFTVPDGQLLRHGVLVAAVLRHEGDAFAVGAVAGGGHVPGGILRQHAELAALEVHLDQREAVLEAFLGGRVEGEDQPLAVRRDVERAGIGLGARELVACALEEVAPLAAVQVEQVQVGHAVHRDLVVPVAVLGLAGDVARLLAVLEGLLRGGLGLGALERRVHPGDEDHAAAIRAPAEGIDAGGHGGGAARLAAVRGDDVELRRLVLAALLLAAGDEGDAVAARAPLGLPVLRAAVRQRARLAAQRREQPQRALGLVVLHRVPGDRGHGLRAVG